MDAYNNRSNFIDVSSDVITLPVNANCSTNVLVGSFDAPIKPLGDSTAIFSSLADLGQYYAADSNTYKVADVLFNNIVGVSQKNLSNSNGNVIVMDILDSVKGSYPTFTTAALSPTQITNICALSKASLRIKNSIYEITDNAPTGEVIIENIDYTINFKGSKCKTINDIASVLTASIPESAVKIIDGTKIQFVGKSESALNVEIVANAVVGYDDLFGATFLDGANGVKVDGVREVVDVTLIGNKLLEFFTNSGKYQASIFMLSEQLDNVDSSLLADIIKINEKRLNRVNYFHGFLQTQPSLDKIIEDNASNKLYYPCAIDVSIQSLTSGSAAITTELSKGLASIVSYLLSIDPILSVNDATALPLLNGASIGISTACNINTVWGEVNSIANKKAVNNLVDNSIVCFENSSNGNVRAISKIKIIDGTKYDANQSVLISQTQQSTQTALSSIEDGVFATENGVASVLSIIENQVFSFMSQRGVFGSQIDRANALKTANLPITMKNELISQGYSCSGKTENNTISITCYFVVFFGTQFISVHNIGINK